MKKYNKSVKGQALLIVLLIMAVSLTVVLSVATRSVTEVSVSSYEEDALRAFSAAEAGVEDALLKGSPATGLEAPEIIDTESNVSYQRNIYTPQSSTNTYLYPRELYSGESATFWLVSQDTEGNFTCDGLPCFRGSKLDICWGNDPSEIPAVEVSMFYDNSNPLNFLKIPNDLSTIKVLRKAYDPINRNPPNNFDAAFAGCPYNGINLSYYSGDNVLPSSGLCPANNTCVVAVSVRMLYNTLKPQQVALRVHPSGGGSLPGQGTVIESTGKAGESTRKVNVFRSYPEIPSIFNSAIFSRKDIVK